jgi:hypothetical protein
VPRMCSCVPTRKVMAAAVGSGAAVLALDLLSPGLGAQATAITVAGAALVAGYLVPPSASDALDVAPRRWKPQITGIIVAS